jgi:protocatechuate 3,4-dioxygenase alpha subunit
MSADGEAMIMIATASQTVGPFFHVGPGTIGVRGVIAPLDMAGERIRVRIQVLDGEGAPVNDAMIELQQADESFTGFGRLSTSEQGTCSFDTIRPRPSTPDQASHVTLCLFMRGLLRHLVTRVYFEGDPALERDAILALVPADRRSTLLARRDADGVTWDFVVRLQGDGETVFFDV